MDAAEQKLLRVIRGRPTARAMVLVSFMRGAFSLLPLF